MYLCQEHAFYSTVYDKRLTRFFEIKYRYPIHPKQIEHILYIQYRLLVKEHSVWYIRNTLYCKEGTNSTLQRNTLYNIVGKLSSLYRTILREHMHSTLQWDHFLLYIRNIVYFTEGTPSTK